jgi:hypothetical protein
MRVVAPLSSLMAQAMRCKLKPWTINGFPSITFLGFDEVNVQPKNRAFTP